MTDHYLSLTAMQRKLLNAKLYLLNRGLAYRMYPDGRWKEVIKL